MDRKGPGKFMMEGARISDLECTKGNVEMTCTDKKSKYQIKIVPDILTNSALVFMKGKDVKCKSICSGIKNMADRQSTDSKKLRELDLNNIADTEDEVHGKLKDLHSNLCKGKNGRCEDTSNNKFCRIEGGRI
jgi:hypothetical protein